MTTPEPPYTIVRSSAELSVDDERIEWPVTLARFSSGESLPAHGTSPRGKESVLAVLWDAGCYDIRLRATVAEEPGCRGAGCSDGSCQRCQAVPTAEWLAWKSRAPVAPPTFEQLVAKVGPLEGTALAAPVAPPEDPRTQDEIDRPAEEVIREIRGTPGGLAALYTTAPPDRSAGTCKVCGTRFEDERWEGATSFKCGNCEAWNDWPDQLAPSPVSPSTEMPWRKTEGEVIQEIREWALNIVRFGDGADPKWLHDLTDPANIIPPCTPDLSRLAMGTQTRAEYEAERATPSPGDAVAPGCSKPECFCRTDRPGDAVAVRDALASTLADFVLNGGMAVRAADAVMARLDVRLK